MLLHIIPGGAFEHYAAEQFETVLPGGNRFVAVLPPDGTEQQVSKKFDYERVVIGTDSYDRLLKDVSRSRRVIFHSFGGRFRRLLRCCPSSCVTGWVLWGGEVYGHPLLFMRTLQPLTASYYMRAYVERKGVLRLAKRCLGPLFPGKTVMRLAHKLRHLRQRRHLAALRRFDYILTFVEEEVELTHRLGISKAKHLPFSYYCLERTVGERFLDMRSEGRDILLGNSASLTNNHLDAIEILAKLDLTGRRVVCPLAYGDASYGRVVVEAGRRRLGDAFVPLLEFMPIEEYNRILGKCTVVVMNHNRSQAMGNIITALWLGAKVYLNDCTTVWKYLRRIGIKAYSISRELRRDNPAALDPPSRETLERNREVLLREFSYDRVLSHCRGVVSELRSKLGKPATSRGRA